MYRKTMFALVGCIIFLMILVVAVDSLFGGLPGSIRTQFEQEMGGVATAEGQLNANREKVRSLVAGDPGFLEPIEQREEWQNTFDLAAQKLQEAKQVLEQQAKPLFDNNDPDDAEKLKSWLNQARSDRTQAENDYTTVSHRAERLVTYKAKRGDMVKEAETAYKALSRDSIAGLQAKADQAASDWPEKKDDLTSRMAVFGTLLESADNCFKFVMGENEKPENSIDFDALVHNHDALLQIRDSFSQSFASIPVLLEQLYVSWDKILSDMEIKEGYEVEFYHHYKMIRVGRDNTPSEETAAQKVAKEYYLKHENNLGMTLESKPKGKYDFEADKQTSPPGYGYVGNSHYGKWERRSGGSFWVFYGQYALMRDLFWGPRYYQPIHRSDWDGYRQARSSGRTYYGRDTAGKTVYGSKGSMAKTKYSNSKYTSSGGYAKTQFKKTGGKYRGTRYATKKTRSTSSKSYSSRSRSSRSFGGK